MDPDYLQKNILDMKESIRISSQESELQWAAESEKSFKSHERSLNIFNDANF